MVVAPTSVSIMNENALYASVSASRCAPDPISVALGGR